MGRLKRLAHVTVRLQSLNSPITLSDYNFADLLEENTEVYAPIIFAEIAIVIINISTFVKICLTMRVDFDFVRY